MFMLCTKLASSLTFASMNILIFSLLRYDSVFQLLAVVSELKRQDLNILLLGRKHMLKHTRSWDKQNMDLIQQKAHCFFTDNMWAPDNLPCRKHIKPSSCYFQLYRCLFTTFCSWGHVFVMISPHNTWSVCLSVRRMTPSCCMPLCTLGTIVGLWAGTWWETTRPVCQKEPPDGSFSSGREATSWWWIDMSQQAGESDFWWGRGGNKLWEKRMEEGILSINLALCVYVCLGYSHQWHHRPDFSKLVAPSIWWHGWQELLWSTTTMALSYQKALSVHTYNLLCYWLWVCK